MRLSTELLATVLPDEDMALVRRKFPNGIEVTTASLWKAAMAGIDLDVVARALPSARVNEYKKREKILYAELDRRIRLLSKPPEAYKLQASKLYAKYHTDLLALRNQFQWFPRRRVTHSRIWKESASKYQRALAELLPSLFDQSKREQDS